MKRFSRKERNGAIAVFLVAVALTMAGFCVRNRIAPTPAAPVTNERILFQSDTEGEEIADSEESLPESSRKTRHKKHPKKKKKSKKNSDAKKSKKNTPEAQPRDFLKEPIETTNRQE